MVRYAALATTLALVLSNSSLRAGMITLLATDDAQIHSVVPNTNINADLAIRQTAPVYTAVKFDFSKVLGTITSATLQVEWRSNTGVAVPVQIASFTGPDWQESLVTWNNMNGGNDPFNATNPVIGSITAPASLGLNQTGTFSTLDVTSTAQSWFSGSLNNRGLLFRANSGGTNAVSFWSIQNLDGTHGAQLILEGDVSLAPAPPAIILAAMGGLGLFGYGWRWRRKNTKG